jgi:hypothetical protein
MDTGGADLFKSVSFVLPDRTKVIFPSGRVVEYSITRPEGTSADGIGAISAAQGEEAKTELLKNNVKIAPLNALIQINYRLFSTAPVEKISSRIHS